MQESLRDELEKLGIYQLRMYARRVGVKLATTLKKADLIDAILQVVSGEKEPYVKKTKKGRPPKEILQIATPTMASPVPTSIMGGRSYDYGFEGLASSTYAKKMVEKRTLRAFWIYLRMVLEYWCHLMQRAFMRM